MAEKKTVSRKKPQTEKPNTNSLTVTGPSFTKGQKMVLYILLSTRSQFRFSLEGIFGASYGTTGTGAIAAGDFSTLQNRLNIQLNDRIFPGKTFDYTYFANYQLLLPPTVQAPQIGGVTTDPVRLRTGIGLDGVYDPTSDPCPADAANPGGTGVTVTHDQMNIVAGILSMIP